MTTEEYLRFTKENKISSYIIADGTIKGFHIVNLLVESIINDREHPEDKKFDWKISPEVMKNDKHCMNFKYDETKYRLLILLEKEIEDRIPGQDDEDSEVAVRQPILDDYTIKD